MELDLGAVRAFIAIADHQHFSEAADQLGLTQQAISKRIAKLEDGLGTTLFQRSRSGSDLTEDGATFLPHARALIALADQASESVRGCVRPLRVDVLETRLAATELIRSFHHANAGFEVDIITSSGLRSGRSALVNGAIDVAFARVVGALDPSIEYMPAYLEPLHVLIGRKHPLAGNRRIRLCELADSVARMPGNEPGSEWALFYEDLAADFRLTIDTSGPDFGLDHLLDDIGAAADSFVFTGERLRAPWHPEVVQIPVVEPIPCYPHAMLWQRRNRHPALPRLTDYVRAAYQPYDPETQWLPATELHSGRWSAAHGSTDR
ncbi:DNA-binding transcriptional LysR family regulator [Nocardia tenerifensis]|uniref:DNA-binding transcriptional LysR family regulator n=1 Tax=Nocardia tenerifensis TaxID=228006 RepID=A0A318JQI8_9NOCA|nr:LysR family transcriptional regulator [Nocardia tenerifensis]PXX58041.1 DNA-binding transcriptional LysR family regulator [Nocardia tenerifensis]